MMTERGLAPDAAGGVFIGADLTPAVPATSTALLGTNSTWREMVAPYLKADGRRAIIQLLTTCPPFFAVMAAMFFLLEYGIWLGMLLFPVGAILLVRLFMFQHDCGHGSFFEQRWANEMLGWGLGVLTLTPYASWRADHAAHHASMGNLDRRGIGDITTLTLSEYRALPKWRRLGYRLYRHPLVMFGIGPIWLFFISNRIPAGNQRRRWRAWLGVLGTNAGLAVLLVALMLSLGPTVVLLGWFPVVLLAAMIGVWLFYVQHQFPNTYWETSSSWDFRNAALQGASFYDLPRPLHWLTGNIGFHHIHHLSSRIPNYRLRECQESNPALQTAPRLSLWTSLKCVNLALWDEERGSLISFRKAEIFQNLDL